MSDSALDAAEPVEYLQVDRSWSQEKMVDWDRKSSVHNNL